MTSRSRPDETASQAVAVYHRLAFSDYMANRYGSLSDDERNNHFVTGFVTRVPKRHRQTSEKNQPRDHAWPASACESRRLRDPVTLGTRDAYKSLCTPTGSRKG